MLARLRERRATDPEWRALKNRQARKVRETKVGRVLAHLAKQRATKRGHAFTITREWAQELWERDPHCAYCRVRVVSEERKFSNVSATLDRVLLTDGYTPENTVLACYRCNTLKRDSTVEELEALAANVRRFLTERGV